MAGGAGLRRREDLQHLDTSRSIDFRLASQTTIQPNNFDTSPPQHSFQTLPTPRITVQIEMTSWTPELTDERILDAKSPLGPAIDDIEKKGDDYPEYTDRVVDAGSFPFVLSAFSLLFRRISFSGRASQIF